ncbi:MAG: hypothetical protein AAFY88_12990 [Acidobacteriota bacterium]
MINPTVDDIGRAVIYRTAPDYKAEPGIITSFNRYVVFVRYGAEKHSQATARERLEWEHGEDRAPREATVDATA